MNYAAVCLSLSTSVLQLNSPADTYFDRQVHTLFASYTHGCHVTRCWRYFQRSRIIIRRPATSWDLAVGEWRKEQKKDGETRINHIPIPYWYAYILLLLKSIVDTSGSLKIPRLGSKLIPQEELRRDLMSLGSNGQTAQPVGSWKQIYGNWCALSTLFHIWYAFDQCDCILSRQLYHTINWYNK